MISGLKGAGVKDLSKYLTEQACFLFGFNAITQRNIPIEILHLINEYSKWS